MKGTNETDERREGNGLDQMERWTLTEERERENNLILYIYIYILLYIYILIYLSECVLAFVMTGKCFTKLKHPTCV
jgi:hypothetical protein